jgi:hypothetical protein
VKAAPLTRDTCRAMAPPHRFAVPAINLQGRALRLAHAGAGKEKIFPSGHSATALSWELVANVKTEVGDHEGALKAIHQALKTYQQAFNPGNPQLAPAYGAAARSSRTSAAKRRPKPISSRSSATRRPSISSPRRASRWPAPSGPRAAMPCAPGNSRRPPAKATPTYRRSRRG